MNTSPILTYAIFHQTNDDLDQEAQVSFFGCIKDTMTLDTKLEAQLNEAAEDYEGDEFSKGRKYTLEDLRKDPSMYKDTGIPREQHIFDFLAFEGFIPVTECLFYRFSETKKCTDED